MPKEMHNALKKQAKKKGMRKGTTKYNRYVHGTMNAAQQRGALEKAEPPDSADDLDRR